MLYLFHKLNGGVYMVRVTSLGANFGNKIQNELRKIFPDKNCFILVREHGRRLQIKIEDVRGYSVDMQSAIKVVNALTSRQPETSFNSENWCSFFYNYE